jgi:hypothetical protein
MRAACLPFPRPIAGTLRPRPRVLLTPRSVPPFRADVDVAGPASMAGFGMELKALKKAIVDYDIKGVGGISGLAKSLKSDVENGLHSSEVRQPGSPAVLAHLEPHPAHSRGICGCNNCACRD